MNIWKRPSPWLDPLRERGILSWYALCMYCRLVRRYQLLSPIPDRSQPLDPKWLGDPVPGVEETESQLLARMLYIAAFGHELSFGGYLSKYMILHLDRWNRRLMREREQSRLVGRKISAHGRVFAYVCTECVDRVRISRLFQTKPITWAEATRACCSNCYRGLDGSEENFDASPTHNARLIPSPFCLLEVGLACEALSTEELTIVEVQNRLLEEGMNWSKASIQAALHFIFPDGPGETPHKSKPIGGRDDETGTTVRI